MIRPQDPISFIANFMLMNKGTTRKIEDVIKEIPKEIREENQIEIEGGDEEEQGNEEDQVANEEEKKEEGKENVVVEEKKSNSKTNSRPGTNNSKKIVKS